MIDERTRAYINLHAVLRNLEDLCRLDHSSQGLVAGTNICIAIFVRKGPKLALEFSADGCRAYSNHRKCDIILFFRSCRHFNDMVDGKANPFILKGFTKVGFLTSKFKPLTGRLAYFLKPTDLLLQDEEYQLINTELTLYTAGYAIAQFGNIDRTGRIIAESIPDGVVSLEIDKGPAVKIEARDGKLGATKGLAKRPRARMRFSDLAAASELLSGYKDSYSCIASGTLALEGYIPMLDTLDKLLFQVDRYLRSEN
ncbi:MAG: hypothetical protein ACYSWO_22305 [Planctomycetota bacterium]|jgi:hypothetical protein